MIFEQIDAGGDRNFSYLIGDEESRLCAVVDPGYDTSKLETRVKDLGLKVAYVLNTHRRAQLPERPHLHKAIPLCPCCQQGRGGEHTT